MTNGMPAPTARAYQLRRDSMNVIDLRSDCLTLPTAAMRQAMANARLG